MISIRTLLDVAEAYRIAAGDLPETTVSHRVFRDTKLIANLRAGSEITVGRFNAALEWFAVNWPVEADMPACLQGILNRTAPPLTQQENLS